MMFFATPNVDSQLSVTEPPLGGTISSPEPVGGPICPPLVSVHCPDENVIWPSMLEYLHDGSPYFCSGLEPEPEVVKSPGWVHVNVSAAALPAPTSKVPATATKRMALRKRPRVPEHGRRRGRGRHRAGPPVQPPASCTAFTVSITSATTM